MKGSKRKIIILTIITLVLVSGIIYGVGRSFGFFQYLRKSEIINIITTGKLSGKLQVEVISKENDPLTLEGAYPKYDGFDQEPFEFTITNSTNQNYGYSISILSDLEKLNNCKTETNESCPELTSDYIKVSYSIDDGDYSEPVLLSEVNNVILKDTIYNNTSKKVSILIWINSSAGNEIQNHYFFGKVILQDVVYKTYAIGEEITLKDGSKWHVLENSNESSSTVVLLSDYNLNDDGTYNTECGKNINDNQFCSTRIYDAGANVNYNENNSDNIGYFIKNVYAPKVIAALPGTTNITLPTAEQIANADGKTFNNIVNFNLTSNWLLTTNYWTKTIVGSDITHIWAEGKYIGIYGSLDNTINGARPVITTLKSNIVKAYTATNLITNGSFENGLSGWYTWRAEVISTQNEHKKYGEKAVKYFKNPSNPEWPLLDSDIFPTPTGHYFYAVVDSYIPQLDSNSGYVIMGEIYNSSKDRLLTGIPAPKIANTEWTKYSIIFQTTAEFQNIVFRIGLWSSVGEMYIDGIMVIDLTQTFGEGNEPTKEWCDNNIGYFDGTKEIYVKVD